MTGDSDAIQGWIEAHRTETVGGLCRLIQFPTVSGAPDPEGQRVFREAVAGAYGWLTREAARLGMRTRNYRDWGLVIEAGEGAEVVGVPLHVDVVPPGEGWRHGDPFSGEVDEGQIWGRGAQDNKGPLTEMLWALAAVMSLGKRFRRRVRLIIGCGEEIVEWGDVEFIRDIEGAPDLSIVPDSSFPVVVAEKGWTDVVLSGAWDADDGPVQIAKVTSGDRPNIVPDYAEAVLRLGDVALDLQSAAGAFMEKRRGARVKILPHKSGAGSWLVMTHGKRAHGSSPQEGHNALVDLLLFLRAAVGEHLGAAPAAALRQLADHCRDFLGDAWGVKRHHEILGPTTASLGVMHWQGREFTATLNVRPTLGTTAEATLETMQRRLSQWETPEGLRIEAKSRGRMFDPFEADEAGAGETITALEEAWRSVTGEEPIRKTMSGTTYAKVFPRSVGFGPWWEEKEPGLFHQIDERIPVDAHLRNVRLYAEALARLAL